MSPPLIDKLKSYCTRDNARLFYRWLEGIAVDFWKDGKENPLTSKHQTSSQLVNPVPQSFTAPIIDHGGWHAGPGEIEEKMWGRGQILPCDEKITDMLIKPVGLTKDMTVIDITAGLGERLLRAHHEFKADVAGMDIDNETALRGAELLKPYLGPKVTGISAYTLPNLVIAKKFDCLFAREIFYRVTDKPKFFQLVAGYSTALGQLSYTDYIVDPENRDRPAVRAWIQNEKGINPLGLVENAEAWAKAGFNLRVYDDQTAMYKAEIMKGILRFSNFIAANRPDLATKRAILKHMDLWGRRVAAIEQGLKFYRIYGIKA